MSESPEVYDPVDLRQRIVLCFTIGELRDLAEHLGVASSIAWQRGIQEAARGVVQQCERYAGLPALVAKLREARPDMDWPTREPPPVVASPDPPVEPAPASAPIADPFAPREAASPIVGASPAFAPVPPLSGPGTLAPAPGRPASFASPPIAVVSLPRAPQPSPVWPGTASNTAAGSQGSQGLDPRILIAVAGLMLVAAIIAYLAGRASNVPGVAGSPAGSSTSRRGDGPAALAADAIDRSIANLARVCELPPGRDVGELVFARVFDRCGPPAAPRPRGGLPPQFDVDAGAAEPPEPAPPTPPVTRPKRPGRAAEAPIEAAPAPTRSCEGACDGAHRSCKQRCGPEPTESGQYEGWQRCMSRCLTDASRCRLACR